MLDALQPFGPLPKTKTQEKHEVLLYGNDFSQAYKSSTQLPIENKAARLGVSKSIDLGVRRYYSGFAAEMQRLHPEISPPKIVDRLRRAIPQVVPPKFLRDNINVSDIEGATVK